MVSGLFYFFKYRQYPLFYPLQVCETAYICFHARRALIFHPLRYMTVYIQSERRRCMTEVFLHCFYIVAVLQRKYGESVP